MAANHTGYGTAALRAIESHRKDALINDTYASAFEGFEGRNWAYSLPGEIQLLMIDMLAVRTRVFEEFTLTCITRKIPFYGELTLKVSNLDDITDDFFGTLNNTLNQIVILGAGYDTKAYRLNELVGTSVFEVDFQEVLDRKQDIAIRENITSVCKKHSFVASDLSEGKFDIELILAGFDTQAPTLWLIEALSGYLTKSQNQRIIECITKLSQNGSIVISTFLGESGEASGYGKGISKKHVFYTDQGYKLFQEAGWFGNQKKIN